MQLVRYAKPPARPGGFRVTRVLLSANLGLAVTLQISILKYVVLKIPIARRWSWDAELPTCVAERRRIEAIQKLLNETSRFTQQGRELAGRQGMSRGNGARPGGLGTRSVPGPCFETRSPQELYFDDVSSLRI